MIEDFSFIPPTVIQDCIVEMTQLGAIGPYLTYQYQLSYSSRFHVLGRMAEHLPDGPDLSLPHPPNLLSPCLRCVTTMRTSSNVGNQQVCHIRTGIRGRDPHIPPANPVYLPRANENRPPCSIPRSGALTERSRLVRLAITARSRHVPFSHMPGYLTGGPSPR
jgi:hypothetical protein